MKFRDLEDGAKFILANAGFSGSFIRVNESDDYNAVVDGGFSGIKFNPDDDVILVEDLEPDESDLIDSEAELRSLPGYSEGF